MPARVLPLTRDDVKAGDSTSKSLDEFRRELHAVLQGKERIADSILCAILSSGHILLEDVPGVGKTTVIKALSQLLGLEMKRIQCTSDLLPSDVLGVEVFNPQSQTFNFHRGPIFSNVVLADELNRASPRTQSALLEAMGEGMVTIDKKTYSLPTPFILFASQNPSDHVGTYSLPESQLDRFSIKIHLDYPAKEKEEEIFSRASLAPLDHIGRAKIELHELQAIQQRLETIHLSDRVVSYVKRFVDATRAHKALKRGVSTRGGVIWLRLARARAILSGRDYVVPDDLVATGVAALCHRVIPQSGNVATDIIEGLLSTVDIE